jgi:hypothetical protein
MWNVFIWFRLGTVASSCGHSNAPLILMTFMWLYRVISILTLWIKIWKVWLTWQ